MRKDKLITLLQAIPGNPEVVFWSGLVDDWMPISETLSEEELVRHSTEFLEFSINAQRAERGQAPLPHEEFVVMHRQEKWDLPNQYVVGDSEAMQHWYGSRRKRIIVLEAKLRGKETYDRLGPISY